MIPSRRWSAIACICAVALLATFIVRTAWVCDDAYITARTIDNWRQGYGLRWNPAERVQTYTHPLWLMVEAAAWRISGEPYWSSLAVSMLFAVSAAILIATIGGVSPAAAAALFFLSTSQAFVDFSTSGLETPLAYLLLAGFLVVYWNRASSRTWVLHATSIAALAAVNRLDTLVLLGPALVHLAVASWRGAKIPFVLGWLPLLAWEAFAIVYYGFPFPNTAYAKLATDIPQSELTAQGFAYLANSWHVDPPTLAAVGAAIVASLWRIRIETLAIACGLVLHLAYVVRVGGDFMSGRFLAPAVVVAVGLILRRARTPPGRAAVAALMIAAGALAYPQAASRVWPGRAFPPIESLIDPHGIADERLVYARDTGLLRAIRRRAAPQPGWLIAGRQAAEAGVTAMSRDSVGFFGYGAGPSVHIVDTLALCDPLLARLPADRPWRIGHFHRPIPAGYMEMLRGRQDHLADPALDEYYGRVRTITRGALWSRARWAAIVALNTSSVLAPTAGAQP